MADLTNAQWCVLDLLLRAKRKGAPRVNRHELLQTRSIPDSVKLQLVFAALTLAGGEYVALHGQHDFEITMAGEMLFTEKFKQPSKVADAVIALPDRSGEVLQ